jgi:hypothetical protein
MLTQSQLVRRTQKNREDLLRRYKAKMGCARCGERHPACLDLAHRDASTKTPKLSKSKNGKWYTGGSMWKDLGYVALAEEILKCEVLCSNCHRKETAEDKGYRYDVPPTQEKSSPARRRAEEVLGLT